jgi:hypothetical protein
VHPLLEIGRAREEAAALAGLERWKARHPDAAAHLHPADVLTDRMRGRYRTWTRVRVNLQHVPEPLRPPQEPLDPDENMADEWAKAIEREQKRAAANGEPTDPSRRRRRPSPARKGS